MLAAYIDGALDGGDRSVVADHVSRCDDCHAVVRETTLFLAEEGQVAGPLAGRRARDGASRSPILVRWFGAAAAVLVVGLGSAVIWRQVLPRDPFAAAVHPLAQAVGSRRFFEPRLVGGFGFGPLVPVKRSGGGVPRAEDWELLAAAARIQKDAVGGGVHTAAALGAAHLVLGEADEAVRVLERVAKDAPAAASVQSDLAAAYLVRGLQGRDEDIPRALETATRALEREPALREALFNRAVALEALGLAGEAARAWSRFLEFERDPGWRGEAERRRAALDRAKASDLDAPRRELERRLAAGDEPAIDESVRSNVGIARDVFESALLPALSARAAAAARLAAAFARVTGDRGLEALLEASRGAGGQVRAARFAQARAAWEANRRSVAGPLFEQVIAAGSRDDAFGLWSRHHLAIVTFHDHKQAAASEVEAVLRAARSARQRLLEGQSLWMLGLIQEGAGAFEQSLRTFEQARGVFAAMGHHEHAAFMDTLLASSYTDLRNPSRAWRSWRGALGRAHLQRDPSRRVASFYAMESAAVDFGLPRVAQAALLEVKDAVFSGDTRLQSDPLFWAMDWARTLDRVSPGQGLRALAGADAMLGRIADASSRRRNEGELAWVRAELSTPESGAPAEGGALDAAIARFGLQQPGGAEAARLPVLYLNRGRLHEREGNATAALADYLAGIATLEAARAQEGDLALSLSERATRLCERAIWLSVRAGGAQSALAAANVAERALELAFGTGPAKPRSLAMSEVARLPASRAVVAWFPGEDGAVALVFSGGAVRAVTLSDASDLGGLVSGFRDALTRHDVDALRAAGAAGFERLVAPVLPLLNGARELAIVPFGELANVPFAALWNRATHRWLIEDFTLDHAPTLRSALQAVAASRPEALLALGDPDTGGRHPRLPHSAAEARLAGLAYPRSLVLVAERATAAALAARVREFDGLHVAAHGLLNPAYPSRSGLALAGDPGELSASAVAALDLRHLRLVVLAACDSGSAESAAGAGGFSLMRPFLQAGAQWVLGAVAGLDDARATGVLRAFHAAVARGHAPAEALAIVQRNRVQAAGEDLATALSFVAYSRYVRST